MKEKIALHREMETLLIPLYGRAESTRQGLCSDPYAVETLDRIEYNFGALKIPKKMRVLHRKTLRFFRCVREKLRAPEIPRDFRAAH